MMVVHPWTVTRGEAELQPAPRYHLFVCDTWVCSTITDELPVEWDGIDNSFVEVKHW